MAGTFIRREINGLTPLDIKCMNDNFKYMWLKVFGNITTGDLMDESVTGDKIKKKTITADNIEAGTITATEINTATLVVGENIQMGENASIVWAQISDRPTIPNSPDDIGAVADDMTAVFNALTNNGTVRGLYMTNGQLYINADYIQSGYINAARIQAHTLIVGDNVDMGANATIAWTKVTGTSNIADKTYVTNQLADYVTNTTLGTTLSNYATLNALADYVTNGTLSQALMDYVTNGNLTTILGYDYIVTGKIAANQIAAGNIAGCTIQTTNSSNYIVLEDQYMTINYGYTPYVRLAYDWGYNGSLQAYLQLNNSYIVGVGGSMRFSFYGNESTIFDSSGMSTNGISCVSISATNNVSISGSLTVYGTKNATIETADYGKQVLSCDESPDVIFSDRGTSVISDDGTCYVPFEAIYRQTIFTDNSDYFVTVQGIKNDVKLESRQPDGFTVSGQKGTQFLWKVEAYRLGYEYKRFNTMTDWETFRQQEAELKKYREAEKAIKGSEKIE